MSVFIKTEKVLIKKIALFKPILNLVKSAIYSFKMAYTKVNQKIIAITYIF